jgi:antitoxin component YwqK of YwqJK toxin-antitoxin module
MVGGAARLVGVVVAGAAAALVSGALAAAGDLAATGGCRDGRAQGPYQLRSAGGQLRIAGAFNEGTRTGSFIFWRDNGTREAHVPYDNGLRNGTVATWYDGPADREPPPHAESEWRRGLRDGITRTWYPDGHRRTQTEYAKGHVVATTAWSEAGAPLASRDARALAEEDEKLDDAAYERRSALIAANMPNCGQS